MPRVTTTVVVVVAVVGVVSWATGQRVRPAIPAMVDLLIAAALAAETEGVAAAVVIVWAVTTAMVEAV